MVYPKRSPTVVGGLKLQHHLYFDEMADFAQLPTLDKVAPGSDGTCVANGAVFILGGDGVWELQPAAAGSGGGLSLGDYGIISGGGAWG